MDPIAKRSKKADKAKRNQDLFGKFSKKAVRQAEALIAAKVKRDWIVMISFLETKYLRETL